MKIFLLEPDIDLQDKIITCLNNYRLKFDVKRAQSEQELYDDVDFLDKYVIFILNLKNPTDPKVMEFIRENGAEAPILLILENEIDPKILKKIYYLSYNEIIVKKFFLDELVFRLYKLCDIWNDDMFFLSKKIYFDFKHATFVYNDDSIHLGKKEALMLKFLFVKSPAIVSYDIIAAHVYQNEIVTQETIRSLIRQIRAKLPLNLIETIKGEGYKLKK
ncbi:winged helix-turn-helix domain-containing protein [Sulfurospirillum arcachonense]|uniref:winged helix-turn-helix domain-containing protein n=1 Tax=Sulfurospirillum arcachonense TaxID=57666 RepID=UPI0004692D28|nr:winged helix-turn-helix domain-containing protein [Sulfurospirillum arcachonense]